METRDFVQKKIEDIRPKLLDLTKRNPLISARLHGRTSSIIRVVDELPDELFYSLVNNQRMQFGPLPALEDDPRDEQTEAFTNAFANALITDQEYLQEVSKLQEANSPDHIGEEQALERALKDRVREALKMPQRAATGTTDISQHALNNDIDPSYELPDPEAIHEDGRHTDNYIQTLMLPTAMERRLNNLTSKRRSFIQETGLNVVKATFGLLEWAGPNDQKPIFSPLVLLDCDLERKATKDGFEFWLSATGEEAESNLVLAEKFVREFGIDLPTYDGGSIEDYFKLIVDLAPAQMPTWRVRRQVLTGVFPSSRLAMYHDLDATNKDFQTNELVDKLMGGPGSAGADGLIAEVYEVDNPEVEKKVPFLVLEADSSQYSTLIDLADGKDLAVEGPPGTGKSQTIVNAISTAMVEGKKVLFVAEKLAALNVVKSRLDDVGLGSFVLPLLPGTSSRQQIVQSIRDRLELRSFDVDDSNYEAVKDVFDEARKALLNHTELHQREFHDIGFKIGEIIKGSTATQSRLAELPEEILASQIAWHDLSRARLESLVELGKEFEEALEATSGGSETWKNVMLNSVDRFTIEAALKEATKLSDYFSEASDAMKEASVLIQPSTELSESAEQLIGALKDFEQIEYAAKSDLAANLIESKMAIEAAQYLIAIDENSGQRSNIESRISHELDKSILQKLQEIEQLATALNLFGLSPDGANDKLQQEFLRVENFKVILQKIEELITASPEAGGWKASVVSIAHDLIHEAGQDVLELRNSVTTETGAISVIEDLCRLGINLRGKSDALVKNWRLPANVKFKSHELFEAARTLRSAGALSFLSQGYRQAKALYLSIARASNFDKTRAGQQLEQLADFLREREGFEENQRAFQVFGLNFDGLQTPFERFQKLTKYLRNIDIEVTVLGHSSLRDILRTAELNVLKTLPNLKSRSDIKLADVSNFIEQLKQNLIDKKKKTERFTNSVEVLVDADALDLDQLSDLIREVKEYEKSTQTISVPPKWPSTWQVAFDAAGTDSDIECIRSIANWCSQPFIGEAQEQFAVALRSHPLSELIDRIERYQTAKKSVSACIKKFAASTGIDESSIVSDRSMHENACYWKEAADDEKGLRTWQTLSDLKCQFTEVGLESIFEYRSEKGFEFNVADVITALVFDRLARHLVDEDAQAIEQFRQPKLDQSRESFREADKLLLRSSRPRIKALLNKQANPPSGIGRGPKKEWTELSLLYNETEKKKRHVPARDLVRRAGNALLELKPCWMMSPLAVAQYLDHDQLEFDLIIIDEASQMPPENALGALLRGRQAMIVGDTNQLPPTNFFRSSFQENDEDDEEGTATTEESILEIANGTFRPKRQLGWHYRSRNSNLIAYSNSHIYENRLIVFPSALEGVVDTGVFYEHVDGFYKAGTNPIEAKRVIEAVVHHMMYDKERSLGVVSLNKKQAELLQQEFDIALTQDVRMRDYIDEWQVNRGGLEEFFIKNLENVQGDERDVIFISTVYGPETKGGRTYQRFGPISGIQGKRRLNVLFSRAKEKIVTFSSMTAADIVSTESQNPGSFMLKGWLEFASTGQLLNANSTGKEPDSEFEVFVIDQIKSMGCEPVPQVGSAGFFIDIGVKHPDWPHGFIMAVECDGEPYHSSKSARDRDRYRQDILESLGWHFYRIWSTDWFADPRGEAEKLRLAIENRLSSLKIELASIDHAIPSLPIKGDPEPDTDQVVEMHDVEAIEESSISLSKPVFQTHTKAVAEEAIVEIGDWITVRYLDDDGERFHFTISDKKSDPQNGIIGNGSPMAEAVLGAEKGEIVDVLRGSKFVSAEIEKIDRNVTAS